MLEDRQRGRGPVEGFLADQAADAANDGHHREAMAWAKAADFVHDAKKKARELTER